MASHLDLLIEPGAGAASTAPEGASTTLGTPEEVEAERLALRLLVDPEIQAQLRLLRAELDGDPVLCAPGAAAQLDAALRKWTLALIMREASGDPAEPRITWASDSTPRTWFGHTFVSGLAGDNPDCAYRFCFIDGAADHEIVGRFPDNPVAEFNLEPMPGEAGVIPASGSFTGALGVSKGPPLLTHDDIRRDADGSFRITIGPTEPVDGVNHLTTPPEPIALNFRDVFSDWRQKPIPLAIRRLAPAAIPPLGEEGVRRLVLEHLPAFIRHFSTFKDRWLGGLKFNSYVGPMQRAGGWSCIFVARYALAPGQAIILTARDGGARYTGAQVTDPWVITSDCARIHASLNNSQAVADDDGDFTYVVCAQDPGVANWLDTSGSAQGFILLRWQLFGPDLRPDALIRDFRLADIAKAAGLRGVARVTPEQRRERMARRAAQLAHRLSV